MEILIAIFSGIAFLALIVYLWNSDSGPKDGSRQQAKEESQSPSRANQPAEISSTSSGIDSERLAELELRIEGLTGERAELLKEREDYRLQHAAKQLELCEAQASVAQRSQRVIELEAENSLLHSRLAELDNQQSSRQGEEMASLQQELGRLNAFEQEAGILRSEKAELIEQLKKLEAENAAYAGRILALQELEARQPELEKKLASLSEQNGRLLSEINGLQSSLRDKIKTQLDGLQELYRKLTPGLN